MAPGDIYQAVEKGTVEGYIFDWSGIVSFGLQEVTANLTTMPVYLGPYFLMMNKDSFNSLPEDLQQILLDNSGIEASTELAWVYEGDEREGREICEAAGCTMIDVTPGSAGGIRVLWRGLVGDLDRYLRRPRGCGGLCK